MGNQRLDIHTVAPEKHFDFIDSIMVHSLINFELTVKRNWFRIFSEKLAIELRSLSIEPVNRLRLCNQIALKHDCCIARTNSHSFHVSIE